ncbi:MAG: iron ABC transporter permease, partial [Cellulosimicrobium funkei]
TAFGVVLVLGGIRYGTIATEIWLQTTQFLDLRTAAVLSVVQLVVVAAALTVANRTRARRERALNLSSSASSAHPLRLWRDGRPTGDLAPAALTAAVVVVLVGLPLGTLVVRSFRVPGGGWGLDNYANLGTTGGRNALSVTVWEAAGNSLRTAALATVLAVVIGGLVALVVSRRPRSRGGRRA